jgi:hypothetical protein
MSRGLKFSAGCMAQGVRDLNENIRKNSTEFKCRSMDQLIFLNKIFLNGSAEKKLNPLT